MIIIDTPVVVTEKLPALKAAGVGAIGRYLNRRNPHEAKVIQPAEARAFAAIGMPLFPIYEFDGRPSGAAEGAADAAYCKAVLPALGMPDDAAIYATVDYDAAPVDLPGILAYFRAFRAPGVYRTGGYGSGYVCGQLLAGLAIDRLRWLACSGGYRGSREALAAGDYEMAQHLAPKLDGLDVDVSVLRSPGLDFGARVPFAPTPAPAPVAQAAPPHPSLLDRLREIFAAA